ncbi:BPSS1187 family protein [Humibacter ginsengiterrae]
MNGRRRMWTTAASALAMLLAGLTAGVVPVPPPAQYARAQTSESTGSLPSQNGKVLSFTLPYLALKVHDPNAQEVAQHAAGDAPLLVFLPATGEVPNNYREYLATAVSVGYSVLGLDYWNIGRSVTRTCRANAECYTQLQQNRYDGSHPSRFSRVGAANSIERRFAAAIAYLEKQDASGDWGRYIVDGHPNWSRVVFAGHSQGGGESAFISHYHRVRGVLMYSSPVETYGDVAASWMRTRGATPPSRMYGFDDVHDIYFHRIVGSWQRLGMGTPNARRASHVPTGGHLLLSSLDIGNPLESHGHTVDDAGPRTERAMVFAPTWRWMLEQVR